MKTVSKYFLSRKINYKIFVFSHKKMPRFFIGNLDSKNVSKWE